LAQWRDGAHLVKAAINVDRFKGWVLAHPFPNVAFNQLSLYRPLLRRLRILKPFGESVDEHQTGRSDRRKNGRQARRAPRTGWPTALST
jgi:hypothetical protein